MNIKTRIIKVYDGDTITAQVDLGFILILLIWLARIDCPEEELELEGLRKR
jgi:hypothetical protein